MRTVLNKYKERLINLSTRNRSLVLKKIYKKRSFDLSKLEEFKDGSLDDILAYLFERNKFKLLLLEDPYEVRIQDIKELEHKITMENSKLFALLKYEDQAILEQKKQSISQKLKEKKEIEIQRIERKVERIIEYSNSLAYLLREINAVEKETGLYELYVGYPFVEGRFQDNTFVKAPLMLFPIRIIADKNCWYLENIVDQEVIINKVFALGYAKYNEVKIQEFEAEFQTLEQFGSQLVTELLKYLKSNKIKIQDNGIRSVAKFVDQTNKDIEHYTKGELLLNNNLVLGQFPISNSIYHDYEKFEKIHVNNTLLTKLLINHMDNSVDPGIERDDKLVFSEQDIFIISPLDYSQENAVKKTNETDQLVVYGPPGTGKSQTITNMISNALTNGKRVLMVSQKRAALDVIYNRLSCLQSKAVLIHDSNKDKKFFYKKVSDTIESMSLSNNDNKENAISKARKIDIQIKALEKVAIALHKPRPFGLTLQKMYSKSKAINSSNNERYNSFRHFKKNIERLPVFCYEQLIEAIDKINRANVVDDFIDYKYLLSKNPRLESLRSDFDMFQALEAVDNINELIGKLVIHEEIIGQFKYNTDLYNLYKNSEYNVTLPLLVELYDAINNRENKDLLVAKFKWWNIGCWINYKKIKAIDEENKNEFIRRGKLIADELNVVNKDITNLLNGVQQIKVILKDETYTNLIISFFDGSMFTKELLGIKEAISDYEQYRQLGFKMDQLDILQLKLLELCYDYTKNKKEFISYFSSLLEFAILANIYDIEKLPEEKGSLLELARFDNLTKEIKTLMNEKNNLTPSIIEDSWNSKFLRHMNLSDFKEFKRQANKKRMLWPIRKYFSEFSNLVTELFPCWLVSPETVSDIMPLLDGMFDIVIFDEASQIYTENAIPTIFRGKQVVIAGDDKQLRPNTAFQTKYDNVDEEEQTLEAAAALEEESLLDLAKVHYDPVYLNYHYRSEYDELINFSNYAFYRGRLQVSPNIVDNNTSHPPIERLKVNGKWLNRTNEVEARKVVELISAIFKGRKKNETIGIITFNVNQKDLIEDLLDQRAIKDPQFKAAYINEINRKDGDEDVSLFVKNIENVQGDERDIIIFSIGYAPDEKGHVSIGFGSLSMDGGENRLNVAISRAKKKIYIITSIEPEELAVDGTKNLGPKLFKKYLQYARAISDNNSIEAKKILMSLIDSSIQGKDEYKFDSDFEMEVCDALTEKGYCVHTQVGVSGYKIDLAIYDKSASRYILGIECDGAAYHSSKSARERDIHRQRYLESRGWKIIRIWSRNWWLDPESEIKKIVNVLSYQNRAKVTDILEHIPEIKEDNVKKSERVAQNPQPQAKSQVKPAISINNKVIEKSKDSISSVGFGDTVVLLDLRNGEMFEVQIEPISANRHLMKDIEAKLLGLSSNQRFTFAGFDYKINEIRKKDNISVKKI